jgi:hypothetical protein
MQPLKEATFTLDELEPRLTRSDMWGLDVALAREKGKAFQERFLKELEKFKAYLSDKYHKAKITKENAGELAESIAVDLIAFVHAYENPRRSFAEAVDIAKKERAKHRQWQDHHYVWMDRFDLIPVELKSVK